MIFGNFTSAEKKRLFPKQPLIIFRSAGIILLCQLAQAGISYVSA